jgi:hypothetical protein
VSYAAVGVTELGVQVWQIREVERVIGEAEEDEPSTLTLELRSHASPIGWENVLLDGRYELRREFVRI